MAQKHKHANESTKLIDEIVTLTLFHASNPHGHITTWVWQ